MASYHCQFKAISRSTGRSAVAAAAYRAGARLEDERTGEVHDYRRRGGEVAAAQIVLPADAPGWARRMDRAALWNAAEAAERKSNAMTAREVELSLPAELSAEDRRALALAFAGELAAEHRVAVDVAIHAPPRDGSLNHHAHVMFSTRSLERDGFGKKLEAFRRDPVKDADGRQVYEDAEGKRPLYRSAETIDGWRERWSAMQNERLAERGIDAQVDHRSLAAQGIEDREAQSHLGPAAAAMERRAAEPDRTRRGPRRSERSPPIAEPLAAVAGIEAQIIDLEHEREQLVAAHERPPERTAPRIVRPDPPRVPPADRAAAGDRYADMPTPELRQLLRRTEPPDYGQALRSDPAVRRQAHALDEATREERAAGLAERQAGQWRDQHRVRAWMQDRFGIGARGYVAQERQAQTAAADATKSRAAAAQAWTTAQERAERRLVAEHREPVAQARAMRAELLRRERAEREARQVERDHGRGDESGEEYRRSFEVPPDDLDHDR